MTGGILPEWREHAACKGMDSGIFFPKRQRGERGKRTLPEDLQAKLACASCRVQTECREWALTRPEYQGTWGGLTDLERKRLLGTDRYITEWARNRQATA